MLFYKYMYVDYTFFNLMLVTFFEKKSFEPSTGGSRL
jgi:hypothetical protein